MADPDLLIDDDLDDDPASARDRRLDEFASPVMACRCGAGLRFSDMHRRDRAWPAVPGAAALIEQIVCADCATTIVDDPQAENQQGQGS